MFTPHVPDGVDIVDDHEERVRRLELRGAFTVTHSILIGGPVTTGMFIPPHTVEVNPDGETPESKVLVHWHGDCRIGSFNVELLRNGVSLATTPNVVLAHGDKLQVSVTDATELVDLWVWFSIRHLPGA